MNSQPKPIVCGGKTYMAYPLTFEDMGEVQNWLDEQQEIRVQSMLERAVERGVLPTEILKYMARSAMDVAARNRLMLGSQEASEALASLDGSVFVMWYSIHKGDPTFTIEDAKAIIKDKLGHEFAQKVQEVADIVGPQDPKSTAPESGSPTPGAAPISPSTGGDSIPSSSARARRPASR